MATHVPIAQTTNSARATGTIKSSLHRHHHVSAGMVFNDSTRASAVRLYGNRSTVLRAPAGTSLLTMLPGAPPVSLSASPCRGTCTCRRDVFGWTAACSRRATTPRMGAHSQLQVVR